MAEKNEEYLRIHSDAYVTQTIYDEMFLEKGKFNSEIYFILNHMLLEKTSDYQVEQSKPGFFIGLYRTTKGPVYGVVDQKTWKKYVFSENEIEAFSKDALKFNVLNI